MPDAPHARDHFQAGIVNGKLVAAGGRQTKYPATFQNTIQAVDVFNSGNQRWETLANAIPTARAGTMTVSTGSEVVVIGGESGSSAIAHNDVEALDVTTGQWRRLQPLIIGRHGGGAVALDNKIHVVSGNTVRGGGAETPTHEVLDAL